MPIAEQLAVVNRQSPEDVAATASSRIWQFAPVLSALLCAPCRTVPSLVRAPGYSSLSCLLICGMSCFFAHLCLAANVLLAVRPGSPKKTKRSSSLNKWSAKFDSLFTSNTRAFPVMPLTAVPLFAQGIARAAPNSGSGMLAGTMILKP